MINWVEMLNWRAYDQKRIEFAPGINFIMGPNGVGKSSILEAVAYALTGESSTVKERGKLLRDPDQPATVRLSFTVKGEEYIIERSQGYKRAESASIVRRRDRKALAHNQSRTTACVEELMSVSSDFLRRIIYMAEGDVFRFLDKPPGEAINAQLQQVLGLNQMNQFIYALETAEKQIKTRVKSIQSVLAALDKLGVENGAGLQERLAVTDDRKRQLWNEIGQARAELIKRQQQNQENQAERAKFDKIVQTLRTIPELQEADQIPLGEFIARQTADLERTRQEMQQHQLAGARAEGELAASRRVLDIVKTLQPGGESVPCPVCGKPMAADECAAIVNKLQAEIEAKSTESRNESALVTEKQKAVRQVESTLAKLAEINRGNYRDYRVSELENQRPLLQMDTGPIQARIALLEQEIAKLDSERAAYLAFQRDLQALELNSPEEARSALVALEIRALSLRAALGASQETLAGQRNRDMHDIYEEIARFWGVFLGGDKWKVELDSDGMPRLENTAGQAFDLSQFSGGEKTALLITLHTIIAHHFARSNFLMIDEPLEHLDSINRRSLIRFLVSAYQGQLFEQALVATFEESLIRKYMSQEGVNVIPLW